MLRLSFIVPFYNVEPYIEECIRSLYDQDIPQEEYEVICVDDCSPDGSRAIVERLQQEYPTLKLLIHQENKRQGGARNTGMKVAQGRYIWYVDSDDYIKPNCLKGLLDLAENEDLDILQFYYSKDNVVPTEILDSGICTGSEYVFDVPVKEKPLLRCCVVWRCLIKSELLRKNNIWFAENVQYEDDDYAYMMYACASRVHLIPKVVYNLRTRLDSTTHSAHSLLIVRYCVEQIKRCIALESVLRNFDRRWSKLIKEMIGWICNGMILSHMQLLSAEEQQKFYFEKWGHIPYLWKWVSNKTWLAMHYNGFYQYWFSNNQPSMLYRIYKKMIKIRLQPIRVFCFHHVCKTFDMDSMYSVDWMQIDEFKSKVQAMQQARVEFISLTDANQHICHDWFRFKKYAVLTFDDGYASLKEILPWLEEQKIPVTLFINGKYLDGKSYRNNPKEKYLTKEELFALTSPLIEIGNHGWEHTRVAEMTEEEFEQSVEKNVQLLSNHPNYIPFWAYTYGVYTDFTDSYLLEQHIIPVYIDGAKNYNDNKVVHRELLK